MNQFYITTSIPYVNGDPHLGHCLDYVTADALARRARLQGKQVIFSTGTDEHGGKISEKAHQLGLSPKELADQVSAKFQNLAKSLGISFNRFIRTTDQPHIERSQLIWTKLKKDIYKGQYTGWYCTGDEAYFSESEVRANKGICPNHNRPFEKIEEQNYFFKLSKYTDLIYEAINNRVLNIFPETRRNEALSLLDKGLEDLSISRPKNKIDWGIPVPGDPSQVMYVWFEALLNYITVLGYPEHSDFQQYWPANIQVIGKDIIRFHAAIWPAILFSLGLDLPRNLYVHGFIDVEGKKMSKSLGNGVDPMEVIKNYSSDVFRYYLLRHIPSNGDGSFSYKTLQEVYNNELGNELGNLVQRTFVMVANYLKGDISSTPPPEHDIGAYNKAFDEFRFDLALDEVWKQIRSLNQYIEETKPWVIAKENDPDHLKEVLLYLVSSINEIAELLQPFMPNIANQILDLFENNQLAPKALILFPRIDFKQT